MRGWITETGDATKNSWQHGPMRRALFAPAALLAAALAPFAASPAQACRLALALGFDVSRSVDAADYRVQIDGITAALFDAEIRSLILDSPDPVAMALFEWAGPGEQVLIVDWMLLTDPAQLDEMARRVLGHSRAFNGLTAVGSALDYAGALMSRAPACLWQTLDMAGDGQSNAGPEPRPILSGSTFAEITVNGLAIAAHEGMITDWFRQNLLHGPGAFVELAPRHEDFTEAFRRKLIRELSPAVIGALTAPEGPQPS